MPKIIEVVVTPPKSERDIAVLKAIEDMKNSEYGVTAIKVEMEAQLNRNNWVNDDGGISCSGCEGSGSVWDYDEDDDVTCGLCSGSGMKPTTVAPKAKSKYNFRSDRDCKKYLDDNVSKEAKKALIFGMFYRDGSVDSEYTFTMPIDHPEYVIEYIGAWNKLSQEVGLGMNTDGAGMHIAILNQKNGRYPEGNSLDRKCSSNFKYSMDRLMPALFFLGSPDHKSRALHFRMPEVGLSTKYSAITGHLGVFEYRVFETCYKKPEAFYDMFCVIANSLKFYKKDVVSLPFFGKIGSLGFKDGTGLDRFYYTAKHVEALEAGVEALRPSYKTYDQLKVERGFRITASAIESQDKKQERQWTVAYNEYKALVEHSNRKAKERVVLDYKRMIKDEGKSWTLRNYGTEVQYIARYGNQSSIDTLANYVANCKKAFNNGDILATIEV